MRSFVAFLFCFALTFSAVSQGVKIQLNENSIVKDSAGTAYPYAVWQALLTKGYSIKAVSKDADTEFLLVRLSEKQVADRLERGPKPKESPYFKTGEKTGLFKTTDIDGHKIDLRDSSGKILVLNFWFINCGPCRREIPDLNELVDSLKTNDKVKFYGIALDERSAIKDFLKKMPFNYTIIDNGKFIADKYGIRSFPTHVIIDQEGKVYFHSVGLSFNTVHWLKKSIKELLAKEQTTAAN